MPAETASALPTLFIPHGGGPCFFMDWTRGPADTWDRMAEWLRGLAASLPERPKAVVVISAHWEAPAFTATAGVAPTLIYDYYGFPEHTYRLTYPAPGAPELARRVVGLLADSGLSAETDPERGFDHGVFIPFKLIFPEAEIPVVQLSLKDGLDPAEHLAAGRTLLPLRREGVLIVGSGMSFHNMRGFGDPAFTPVADRFDDWLTAVVESDDSQAREAALADWAAAPEARLSHPREEHLIPLMVAAGAAAGEPARRVFSDRVMETRVSGYRFG